ncbi:MAG: LD-carboxypeptidase [Candidatus Tectomicrobia bacterium]|uniref:LD-carboxypeptidase n=1 Tax=Tectimicrobiota bacterium TaxID=2528274 RepID=A0A932CNA5_UNCTE|nr:LD-carboxypeptidase [Candidatus Tectomicrobia bacterium]
MRKPPALTPGDLIGIVAPAGPFDQGTFERGIAQLQALGFRVTYGPEIFHTYRYLAGRDASRAEQLLRYFTDPEVKAIFCARGGYGSLRLIRRLAPQVIRAHPKIFMGYSDITTLLLYLQFHCSLVAFHGPMVAADLGRDPSPQTQEHLLRVLGSPQPPGEIWEPTVEVLRKGVASGPLTGGCLTLVALSLGTPFEIQTQGAILFLEDVGERPYRIDRMLTYLRLAGKLRGVKGILFGTMEGCAPPEGSPYRLQAVIADALRGLRIPILYNFPAGHGDNRWVLPFGVRVTLDGNAGRLILEEGAVREN